MDSILEVFEKKLSQCRVMVVDDTETNINILVAALGDDYRVSVAMDGKSALEDIEENSPDLILLDVMMPEMDGYEVCRRLKADEKTSHIPIIFVTAKGAVGDETRGLMLGAIDYLTKPISPSIVKARVKNHLQLKLAQEALKKQNEILKENAQLREDVERISRHDLKTPLNAIIGFPQLMKMEGDLNEDQKDYLDEIEKAGYTMLDMVNRSLDLYKMEVGKYTFEPMELNLLKVIDNVLSETRLQLEIKNITVHISVGDHPVGQSDDFQVLGETMLCYSMLANLIKNAIEASPENEQLTIALNKQNPASIRIHNHGAVPESVRHTFFEKYTTAEKKGGTGLGTYSAKLIAETLGGSIRMESSEMKGTEITICLPIAE